MAENFYTLVTQVGLAKITNAQLTSSKLDLTTIVVGDGNGAYYNPTSSTTSIKREVWRGAIGSIGVDESNPNWLVVETVVPATVGGFTVREVGLVDAVGDLIAIGKYPETYKPVLADGSSKDLYIRMIIEVASTSAVTLKIDPAVVIASRKYVDDSVMPIEEALNNKVGKIAGKQLSTEDFTPVEKTKLAGIETGANKYTHPTAHPASMITESSVKRFVSDAQAAEWNAKETVEGSQEKVNKLAGVGNTKTVKQVDNAVTTHLANKASLTKDGHVQLSSEINSTDETKAATPNAIKKVNDAVGTLAGSGNTKTVKQIDEELTTVKENVTTHSADNVKHITPTERNNWNAKLSASDLKDATTTQKGITQLNNTTSSTSTTQAATANAVKTANDNANQRYTKPSNGIPKSDLETTVQSSLNNADSALQSVPNATTATLGIVQLSSSTTSTSTTQAATPSAVNSIRNSLDGKANKSQEAWIKPVLLNGWINRNLETRYFKDEFGLVHIEGYVEGGTTGLIFTLPTGYRPDALIAIHGLTAETPSYPINMLISALGELTSPTVGGVFPNSLTFRSSFRAK